MKSGGLGNIPVLQLLVVDSDCTSAQFMPNNRQDSPLIETEASIKPIKVVGTRIKLELRRYEAHAYPATSVTNPPPTTKTGSVRMVPNESMASTTSSMVWTLARSLNANQIRVTHVHSLVELSSVDDLPGNLDLVVVEILLDLVLVDGVNDWLLAQL